MRGDRPRVSYGEDYITVFTPHARGSTVAPAAAKSPKSVYPACAGIDPGFDDIPGGVLRLPRMRGDRPFILECKLFLYLFTPHARGST